MGDICDNKMEMVCEKMETVRFLIIMSIKKRCTEIVFAFLFAHKLILFLKNAFSVS